MEKGAQTGDTKCSDQFSNLKKFAATYDRKLVSGLKKQFNCTEYCRNEDQYNETVMIAQFFLQYQLIMPVWKDYKCSEPKKETDLPSILLKGTAFVTFNF